jgi:hypothetical protein
MLILLLSEYLTITDATFHSILSQNYNRTLFIKLSHPAAPPHDSFTAAWSGLVQDPPNITTLSLGEYECSNSSLICDNLTGGHYPAAVWLEPACNITMLCTSDSLTLFIRAMSVYPFSLGKDWEYACSRSDPWTPQPLISLPNQEFPLFFPILKKVFCRLNKSAMVRWQSPAELQVLRAGFKAVSFHGKWEEEKMYHWLKRTTISRCELLTDEMFELLRESGKPVVHFFISPEMKWADFWPWIQLFPPYQYTYLPYDPQSPFVKQFHAQGRTPPVVIYYIPGTNVNVLYKGPVDPQNIGDWLADIDAPPGPRSTRTMTLRGRFVIGAGVLVALGTIVAACRSPETLEGHRPGLLL